MILTKRKYLMVGGSVLLAVALGVAAATLPKRSEAVTLPESTAIHVTLDQALASDHSTSAETTPIAPMRGQEIACSFHQRPNATAAPTSASAAMGKTKRTPICT